MNTAWIVEWFCSIQGWIPVNVMPIRTRKRAREIMRNQYRRNPAYRNFRFRVSPYVRRQP